MNIASGVADAAPVALLIDGENLTATHADFILAKAGSMGRVSVRRVYGSVDKLAPWLDCAKLARVCTHPARNSADMRLCVDAMDLFLRGGYRIFLIGSSDGDFTHLATYLRESGCHVEGIGKAEASERFRAACDRFTRLPAPTPAIPQPPPAPPRTQTEKRVATLLREAGEKGLPVTEVGDRMLKRHGTKTHSLDGGNWPNYLRKRPKLFELDACDRVRLRTG